MMSWQGWTGMNFKFSVVDLGSKKAWHWGEKTGLDLCRQQWEDAWIFALCKITIYNPNIGAPRVFSWRLNISIIWGIIKTEDLKTKSFKIWRTEDIIIFSFVTIETCCLRLKIWRQHILNLTIQNLVLCAGSPNIFPYKLYSFCSIQGKQNTLWSL